MDAIKILGGLLNSGAVSSGSGANILNTVLKMATQAGQQAGGQQGGGLGGLLGGLLGGGNNPSSGGGLGDMLGSLLGSGQSAGGGQAMGGGLGGLLGAALGQYTQSQSRDAPPTRSNTCDHLPEGLSHSEASDQATLLIRAMINAAKSDGRVDAQEQEKNCWQAG